MLALSRIRNSLFFHWRGNVNIIIHRIMDLALVIFIIIIALIIFAHHRASRESLTSEECGIAGVVTLPYSALGRFTFAQGRDSVKFGEITTIAALPADLAARHVYLADKCDATPGCIAFNSSGVLKSGVIPSQAYTPYSGVAGGGLWVRKCATAEPLYAELYRDANFAGTRVLFPVGSYSKINAAGLAGVIGAAGNDWVSSAKIPVGLRVTLYEDGNFGGKSRVLLHGDHKSLAKLSFNDKVSSLKVEYDSTSNPRTAYQASAALQI